MEISTIIAKISKKKIRKQLIEVEVMSPSTSVVISNITDTKRNEEFLSLYFTNVKFSGVSEYDNLEILNDGRVIVHLQDQASKDHKIKCITLRRWVKGQSRDTTEMYPGKLCT